MSSIAPPKVTLGEGFVRPNPWDLGQNMIVIAGPVGANKAVLSEALTTSLAGASMVAFSDHLKRVCARMGIEPTYANLQNLGLNVIEQQGFLGYCVATVREAKLGAPVVVVDGLRHVLGANAIRRLNRPNEAILIYVNVTPEEQREHLLAKREPEARHRAILEHPVEAESTIIRHLADRVVGSASDAASVVADLQEMFIEKRTQDRDELYRLRIVDNDTLYRLSQDAERFEVFREVSRFLIRAFGDDPTPLKRWLRLRSYMYREHQSALGLILNGEPTEALRHAINFVIALEKDAIDEQYLKSLRRQPLSEFFTPLAEMEFGERSSTDVGRETDL